MPKELKALETLAAYLPNGSYATVAKYITTYSIQLTITKDRKSILGNYKSPMPHQNHQITINGGLNMYNFLITLIHEIAHLTTYVQYRNTVEPHGKQWQAAYRKLLDEFVELNIFPNDIIKAIRLTQQQPAASSCAEVHLTKALSNYDSNAAELEFVERLAVGQQFTTPDGRVFVKGEKRRTRHFAKEPATGKMYLFSGVYKVKVL